MQEHSNFIPFQAETLGPEASKEAAKAFYQKMDKRRTLREFSDKPVSRGVVENIIMAASTAPSGAHKQPWTFCAVGDPALKKEIRTGAEKEEYENYHGRMTDEWLKDLEPFETDWNKPFLEIAPWLIVVFKKSFDIDGANNEKKKNYYVNESVGIATGMLLAAVHHAGLVSLTHTPSPMNFLGKILGRPENERPFLLIPIGYPAENPMVPDLERKPLEEVSAFFE